MGISYRILSQANTQVFKDALCGHLDGLKKAVAQPGFDVNVKGTVSLNGMIRQNITILWTACVGGQLKTVQYLLATFRPDLEIVDGNCDLLWASCFGGNLDVVKLTYSRNGIYASKWRTPLSAACLGGDHVDVVAYLISKGHDVNARLVSNQTALHIASEKGQLKIVGMLIKAGAKELKDDYGLTPIETAAALGQATCVEAFIKLSPHKHPAEFLKQMELLVVARKFLEGDDSNTFFREAVEELEKNQGDLGSNYPPAALLEAAHTCLMEPGKMRNTKLALLIFQQVLGMGNRMTIFAFRQYMEVKQAECNNDWLFLFDSLSKELKPLDDQLIFSLERYLTRVRGCIPYRTFLSACYFQNRGTYLDDLPLSGEKYVEESMKDILNILLGELIRGYRAIRLPGSPSWYSDQYPVTLTSNFDELLRMFLWLMRKVCKSANAILEGELLSPCVWMAQNSIKDSEGRVFIQLWLTDAVEETDHNLFIGLLKLVSNIGRDDLFASQDCRGQTVLDEAISLKRSNVEIISHLLQHSSVQPKVTKQLFITMEKLKNDNHADVALELRNRVPINAESVPLLIANTDDISSLIEFAGTITDKTTLSHIANACLERNKLAESVKLYEQCEDFSRHSAVFEKALKDNNFAEWGSVVKYLTSALKVSRDPEVEKELVAAKRMAALLRNEDSRPVPSSPSMEDNLCDLCFDREKDAVFVPCGHMGCCMSCSQKVKICPFCSTAITSRQRIFRT